MNKIKLIALDMDGTLLKDDQSVSAYTKEVIAKALAQNVQVVLCTGRPLEMCYTYAEHLQLDTYIITNNGAQIWTVEHELIEQHLFVAGKVESLWQIGAEHDIHMWAVATDTIFRNSKRPDHFNDHDWLKIGYGNLNKENKDYLLHQLQDDQTIEITNSSPNNLEINPIGVNKLRAIQGLCQLSDLTLEEVMAVGDSMNDFKMLAKVGLGVAVQNAQQEILDIADVTTDSNNNDGVAKAIEKYVLHENGGM